MRVSRHELARLLGATVKVVETHSRVPILSTVRLVGKDGTLTITATDLDIEVTAHVAADGELSACVDAKLLASIVNKLPNGAEITLELKDGSLAITSGRSRFKLGVLPIDDFPSFNADGFTANFDLDLASLFAPVQFAISTEETRYYLNGVYIHAPKDADGNATSLVAVATDGHRLSRHAAPSIGDIPGVIIPRKLVSLVPKGSVSVSLSATKIRIVSADATYTSKLIDGTFPDYQRVIPTGNDKIVTFSVPEMKQAADRVSVVSSERGGAVKLGFADNVATLSVNNPDSGSASEEVAVNYDGEPIEIGFNSAYLTELVSKLPAGDIRLALADAGSPAVFTSDATADLLMVLMPMRVN